MRKSDVRNSGTRRVPSSPQERLLSVGDRTHRNPVSPRLDMVTLTANQCTESPLALAPKIPFRPINLQQRSLLRVLDVTRGIISHPPRFHPSEPLLHPKVRAPSRCGILQMTGVRCDSHAKTSAGIGIREATFSG